MRRKNHYRAIVFLDGQGRVEVDRSVLVTQFREDMGAFPMDYIDPVAGFTGQITAVLLGAEEIDRALAAYWLYKDMLTYPAGYEQALLRARRCAVARGGGRVRLRRVRRVRIRQLRIDPEDKSPRLRPSRH